MRPPQGKAAQLCKQWCHQPPAKFCLERGSIDSDAASGKRQGSVDLSDERMNAANEGVYRKIELVMDGAISDAHSVVEKLKSRMRG